jgi:hypothetical protein
MKREAATFVSRFDSKFAQSPCIRESESGRASELLSATRAMSELAGAEQP